MGPLTQWRGQSDTADRRFWKLVGLSLVAHAPLTPLAGLLALLGWLSVTDAAPPPPVPPMTTIPVDLLESEELPSKAAAVAPGPPSEPESALVAEPPEKPRPERKPREPRDAGVPDAESESADASLDAGGASDAGPDDGGIASPVAAGGDKRVVDPNANVQILISAERIRSHPLGPRIGRLLGSIAQWREFFGPAALDPVADVDWIRITGPQLRDSSMVVAELGVNAPEERVRAALEAIVAADRAGGAWLDAGVPAAMASADRAERVFVMPSPGLVVVAPAALRDAALEHKPRLPTFAEGEVVRAFAVTPWRIVRHSGLPVEVSKSIAWVKARVIPGEAGGAVVELEAKDESPEAAREHAAESERNLRALAEVDLGILGALLGTGRHRFVEHIEFGAKGSQIRGRLVFTAAQLAQLLNFAGGYLSQRRPLRGPLPSAAPPASASPSREVPTQAAPKATRPTAPPDMPSPPPSALSP